MAELIKVNAPVRKPLFEGVQGENEARSIQFDITPWVEELGDGAVTATAKRSQDSQPYPVTVTKDGTTVTWKPTSTDTAYAGVGSFQLEYTVDSVLAKTCIWSTMVAPSLDPAGDPPDPYDNWFAEMRQIAADALQDAQDADASAQNAEAWAKGTKNGTPVSSSDAQYQNNAKYWAEQSLANQYGAFIVKSASGSIASFNDGADDVPMKSVKVAIVPKQSGSGDPSPDNVRPITGTSTANVTVAGKNMIDPAQKEETSASVARWHYSGFKLYAGVNYALTSDTSEATVYITDLATNTAIKSGSPSITYTPTEDVVVYFRAYLASGVSGVNLQLELGTTATAYEPYNGHTTPVPLGQTVYGGTVDVGTGVLTVVPISKFDLKGKTWSKSGNTFYTQLDAVVRPNIITNNIMCNAFKSAPNGTWFSDISDLSCCSYNQSPGSYAGQNWMYFRDDSCASSTEFKTKVDALNEFYIIAPTSNTPQTVQLTPAQVASLLGTNNVWADCGAVEVEYRADPTLAYNELANVIVSLGGNL